MRARIALALLLVAAPGVSAAWAQDAVTALKPGAGQDVTQAVCSACHTLGYIQMNSPFLNTDGWTAEVTKMRAAYGASFDDAQAATIVKYLSTTYGAPAS